MADEKIDHPAHYGGKGNPYEAISVIEAWQLGFCLGNTVKYIARAGRKPDELAVDDLRARSTAARRRVAVLRSTDAAAAAP